MNENPTPAQATTPSQRAAELPLGAADHRGGGLNVLSQMMAGSVLLPSQTPSSSGDWTPEKRLAAAVFESAISDLREHSKSGIHHRRAAEAESWVLDDDTSWPFSFLRLCDLFGLDSEWVRARVAHWMTTSRSDFTRSRYRHAA
jgi:hypothetical protein